MNFESLGGSLKFSDSDKSATKYSQTFPLVSLTSLGEPVSARDVVEVVGPGEVGHVTTTGLHGSGGSVSTRGSVSLY